MSFDSVKSLLKAADRLQQPLWQVILEEDLKETGMSREASLRQMRRLWEAMKSASNHYDEKLCSASGLVGGDGAKMDQLVQRHEVIGGDFLGQVIAQALRMGECNACMKRIVAAPTAGSCGVLPAVLIPFSQANHVPDDTILQALYISAGFGQIIATRASIAGAEGGCQAEVGSASAMAAASLVFLKGGTPKMSAHACAMALKNLMGLVCDPVAGLVEVPCIKRNVVGAVNAISCADMALAGIESRIPPDEVIDAMRAVGDALPASLRETGEGGLAATPTGMKIAARLRGEKEE
ncbi:MAG: L-serine ammonia-lyase, iron-sulfur-dependent, subunit alpha [Massiliimalia sp.]|jgi:L-serine dehydratase